MSTGERYIISLDLQVKNDKVLASVERQFKELAKVVPDAQMAMGQMGKATNTMAKSAKVNGYVIQNMGYQFSDLAVQISGGVSPVRALSQQLPQMFAGMGHGNPILLVSIAAFSAIAASMPIIIDQFKKLGDSVPDMADAFEDLNTATGKLGESINLIDMTSFKKSFNEAEKEIKAYMVTLLQLNKVEAQRALSQAKKSATASDVFSGGFMRSERPEAAGVGTDQFQAVKAVIREFQKASPDLEKIESQFELMTTGIEGATEEYQALVRTLLEGAVALRDVGTATEALAEAEKLLASGGAFVIPEKQKKATKERVEALTAEEKQVRANIAAWNASRAALDRQGESYRLALDPVYAYEQEMEKLGTLLTERAISLDIFAQAVINAKEKMETALNGDSMGVKMMKAFDSAFQSFVNGVAQGTADIKDLIKNMVKAMIAEFIKLAAYKTIMSMFGGNQYGAAFGQATGATAWAKGGAFDNGNVIPFANGGIVNQPTMFPMARGMGLMGEAGAEAVMPLSRMSGGDLGVKAAPVNVTVNNNGGVDVQTSTDSNGGLTIDIIKKAIAGDLRSGGNDIANAAAQTFGLNRGVGAY